MFSRLKISARLIGSVIILSLLAISTGLYGNRGIKKMQWYLNGVTLSGAKLVEYAQGARADINAMRRYEKDVLLNIGDGSKPHEYKKIWDEHLDRFYKQLDAMENLSDSAREKESAAAIKKNIASYAAGFNNVYGEIAAGSIRSPQDGNKAMAQFKDAARQADGAAADLAATMDKRLEGAVKEANEVSDSVSSIMTALAGISVVLSTVLATFLIRSIVFPIRRVIAMLKDIAEGEGDLTKRMVLDSQCEFGEMVTYFNRAWDKLDHMIAHIVELSTLLGTYSCQLLIESSRIMKNSQQIAGQSASVATASEEMSTTAIDIARNCALAADSSLETRKVAVGGKDVVQKTVDRMNLLKREMEESSEVVERLGSSSERIGEVANTIQDIADQTNLLALNAAIEAARAGEQGRGFAVVADEVRALAERTSRATREIGDMIASIQTEALEAVASIRRSGAQVEQGVVEANASGEALGLIIDRIGEVAMQISQIATAAEEQTATVGEIVCNIGGISGSSEMFDQNSSAINGHIQQFQQLADELKQSTAVFKTDTNELLMLDTAKYDHVMFVNRIERCLNGKEQVEAAKLPDHTCCRFGKWYFGDGMHICGSAPSFKAIDGPHELIHRLAKESVNLFNSGNSAAAAAKLNEVEDLSAEIVTLLDRVKSECQPRYA